MQRECEMQGKDWQHPQGKEKVNKTKHIQERKLQKYSAAADSI